MRKRAEKPKYDKGRSDKCVMAIGNVQTDNRQHRLEDECQNRSTMTLTLISPNTQLDNTSRREAQKIGRTAGGPSKCWKHTHTLLSMSMASLTLRQPTIGRHLGSPDSHF